MHLDHWKALPLLNGWQYYGTPFEPVQYRIDAERFVSVRGLVKLGTAISAIGTLPVNFRPGYTYIQIVENNGTAIRINIGTDGVVSQQRGTNVYVSLSGVRFLAEG